MDPNRERLPLLASPKDQPLHPSAATAAAAAAAAAVAGTVGAAEATAATIETDSRIAFAPGGRPRSSYGALGRALRLSRGAAADADRRCAPAVDAGAFVRRGSLPRVRSVSHLLYTNVRRHAVHGAGDGIDFHGDFEIHDFINEKTRSHVLRARLERERGGHARRAAYVAKIYLVLLLLGVGAGLIAASLDLVVDWLSDVKFGRCRQAWYISRAVCCHSAADLSDCTDFVPWSDMSVRAIPLLRIFSNSTRSFSAYVVVAVSFGAIAAFLVKRFAPYAAGSGVPEVKTVLSGVEMKGYLSLWAMVVKIVGLGFAVATGLNLGKEGPFVHLASALAAVLVSHVDEFKDDFNLLLEFVTAGTAAGVSVAFNAPIGGVLFAFEEAATYFPHHVLWRSFFASTIAAITLKLANPFLNGRAVMFEVDHSLEWYWFEMVLFFCVGALGGLVGSVFIRFNVMWSRYRLSNERIKRSPILEAVILIILTALCSYFVDFLQLTNTEIITTLFSECSNLNADEFSRASILCADNKQLRFMFTVLAYGACIKLLLTILTFGIRLPAGLFIPSMTIGACVGRMVGEATKLVYTNHSSWIVFHECSATSVCVRPSIYAIVGAASALAGVTQVSVSLIVIMFELTGGLSHLLPTMIGILAAKLVCTWFECEGIYDYHILLKQYPFLNLGYKFPDNVPARDIMRKSLLCITEKTTVGIIRSILDDPRPYYGWPIIRSEEDMILSGNVVRAELERAMEEAAKFTKLNLETTVSFAGEFNLAERDSIVSLDEKGDVVLNFSGYRDRYLCQVGPETPLSEVHECFADLGVRMCFVSRHGELLGLISKKNIIAYHDIAEKLPARFFPSKL
jgi:chloride channel 3/4/5